MVFIDFKILLSTAEIDECIRSYHRCDPNAACQNTVGSYICTCKGGFYGNGKKCYGNYHNPFLCFPDLCILVGC